MSRPSWQPGAAIVAAALLALPLGAQTTTDSVRYDIWNHGRKAGEMMIVSRGDTTVTRYWYQDRQRGPSNETRYVFLPGARARGELISAEVRSLDAARQPANVIETMTRDGATTRWTARGESAQGAARGTFYVTSASTPYERALLAQWLLAQPAQSGALLPVGRARAFVAVDTTLPVGSAPTRVRLVMVESDGASAGVWVDADGRVVASDAGWFVSVRAGAEAMLPSLRAIEKRWHAERAAEVARLLAPPPASAIVIRNGDLFDSERGTVRPRTTVIVRGDRITWVGPADSAQVPAGATIIDATGRTVMPGMWDMHTHLFLTDESSGLRHLAAGVTTVRDMASDEDVALSRRARADSGTIVGPRMILAGFIEGPGAWAGPSEVLVHDEVEARAGVARYDTLGYKQIKLYNLVHPDLVPVIAAEAKKRGMRLSGHIPRGMSIRTAVALGFDEVNHAAFLLSTFWPESLFVPRMRAYSNFANELAPTFDVSSPQVSELIAFLREKGTVVDGTFNLYQDRSGPLADGTDPVFGPTIAWFPPSMQRGLAYRPPGDWQAIARSRASAATYNRYLKRLYDAGVTLVPGTDNIEGLSFHGELEAYERAGIPATAVLQIATIVPARVMQETASHGSIAAGKVADIAIVAGKPHERVSDLRKMERVLRGGRPYESRKLWEAVGLAPR